MSGGDIANEILPYLDFDAIASADKSFWGYSDLTTVLNAIYTKTGKPSVLYQVRNVVRDDSGEQRRKYSLPAETGRDSLLAGYDGQDSAVGSPQWWCGPNAYR